MGIKDVVAISLITCGLIVGVCTGIVGGAGGIAGTAAALHCLLDDCK